MLQTWLNLSSSSYQISLNLNWIVYVDLKKKAKLSKQKITLFT